MYSFLLKQDITEKNIAPCYLLYGEEVFLAEEFIREIKSSLIPPEQEPFAAERFNLEDSSWIDILDSAKTAPFFFSSWRIIIVDIPKNKAGYMTTAVEQIFQGYLSSPQVRTVMILILPFKANKAGPFYKMMASSPKSTVCIKEMKPLKGNSLLSWMDKKLALYKKTATKEAKSRLMELTGNNLSLINNEMEKVITFAFEKEIIELDDVSQVSGWIKSFLGYEIVNSLEQADYDKSLLVLNKLIQKEKIKSEFILGSIAKFFREILLAKLWLRDKKKSRKAIFRELRPRISEKFGNFYAQKFREFFSQIDRLTFQDINAYLQEIQNIDIKSKTSGASPQILLEGFLYQYCSRVQKQHREYRSKPTLNF